MAEGGATTGARGTQDLPIPFASRSVRTEWLRHVATALEVPVTACGLDLGFMLGGRLTDMGQSPADVRAFVDSGEEERTDPEATVTRLLEEQTSLEERLRAQAEELEGAHHSLSDAQRTIEQRTGDGVDTKADVVDKALDRSPVEDGQDDLEKGVRSQQMDHAPDSTSHLIDMDLLGTSNLRGGDM